MIVPDHIIRLFVSLSVLLTLGLHAGEERSVMCDDGSDDSPDRGLQISGFIQSIGFVGIMDDHETHNNRFVVRRARLDTRMCLGNSITARIQGDFASSSLLLDAYADIRIGSFAVFRMGRFKSPLSMERGQSVPSLLFNDFAYTASLAPNRDIGIAFSGTFFHRFLKLQLACLNGAGNGASSAGDSDDAKDGVLHFALSPFSLLRGERERSLVFAFGVSAGNRRREASGTLKTPTGTAIFYYKPSVVSDGMMYRFSPQFKFLSPHFFLLGEYMYVNHGIADSSGHFFRACDQAWTLTAGYMICGGERSEGGVTLKENAEIFSSGKGALELVARMHGFYADPEQFDVFVSPAHSVERVLTLETGFQWYFAKNSCMRFIYTRSAFKKGLLDGDRKADNAIMLSINIAGRL